VIRADVLQLAQRGAYGSAVTIVRASVVQAAPLAFDLQTTLARVAHWVDRAAAESADLVVFPEAFVGGYPKGADFGVRVGQRSAEGRELFRRYHAGAIDVPGPETQLLGSLAASRSMHLVIGVIERQGGTLYCTVLFFGADGALLGKHRKLMPTAMERVIWGTGDGSTMPVFATPVGHIGAVICWENYMPLLRAAMYSKGIQLYCAPTVDERESWTATMRHVALEGRCFVLSANQFALRRDFPPDYPIENDDPDAVLIAGGSCIISPLGTILAGPARGSEQLLTADLDLDEIARGTLDLDVVGHYARPDVFQLTVDERAKHGVVSVHDERTSADDEPAQSQLDQTAGVAMQSVGTSP
jgi:nitrilase